MLERPRCLTFPSFAKPRSQAAHCLHLYTSMLAQSALVGTSICPTLGGKSHTLLPRSGA